MSRSATVELTWADGDYTFRLGWGELVRLQEACDAGPYFVLGRLQDGTWRMQDISETLRLGLIGGGKAPADATKLVKAWVQDRPPMENLAFAQGVLGAALMGSSDETPGEIGAGNLTDSTSTLSQEAS
ncbi:gene transfer agent family protein [Georhizobium profundi]|uniref:Gene transfer agent family protein n=1 Tax=Georhizobium profundi TaxID=2341112 RepID=A0A3Q8XP34_9HYPH|nr:gene transfer agent family protein [Georhizobium profundi]AZN72011.1 gene transfer agent family protein [Georhizobium profundi]